MKYFLSLLTLFTLQYCSGQNLTPAQKDSLIAGIKSTVLDQYVIENKAKLISKAMTTYRYTHINSVDSMVTEINKDLFRLSNDLHLFIQYRPTVAKDLLNHVDIHTDQNKNEKEDNYGFDKTSILEGNIGYLKLKYFADTTGAIKTVLDHIQQYHKTAALIIDLRNNPGGNGTMLQLLCGVFLPVTDSVILKINYKTSGVVNLKSAPVNPDNLYLDQPLYILCNGKTYSAAEAFAFIMKNRGRAVIIGEKTAGAGNVGGPYPILDQFVLNVPVGIIVDPLTNSGWEHTGVTPNVITTSEAALDKAIELIQALHLKK